MPHIKHFQQIADLHHTFDALYRLERTHQELDATALAYRKQAAADYLHLSDALSLEELLAHAAIEDSVYVYLLAVENGVVRGDAPVRRPDADVAIQVFQERIDRMCAQFGATEEQLAKDPFFAKRYAACKYYRFQFSLPGWVNTMPESVPDIVTKYGKRSSSH